MYGGSFDPLHLGHIHNIIRAAAMCEELYVIISWSEGRESTSKEMRLRWIKDSFSHMHNVHVLLLEDNAPSKAAFNTDYYWQKGADDIKALVGKHIDVVFCGSDYLGSNRFESLYCPESIVHYFDRREIPISSTDIRKWALENWKYIPRLCKPFYAKKVLIVGSRRSGKTTMANNLALAYNTVCVPNEHDHCSETCADDILRSIFTQSDMIEKAAGDCNRILFADTEAETLSSYSDLLQSEESCAPDVRQRLSESLEDIRSWDLVLYLEPDESCEGDTSCIEDSSQRKNKIKALFEGHNVIFEPLAGDYLCRFNTAKQLIEDYLEVTASW